MWLFTWWWWWWSWWIRIQFIFVMVNGSVWKFFFIFQVNQKKTWTKDDCLVVSFVFFYRSVTDQISNISKFFFLYFVPNHKHREKERKTDMLSLCVWCVWALGLFWLKTQWNIMIDFINVFAHYYNVLFTYLENSTDQQMKTHTHTTNKQTWMNEWIELTFLHSGLYRSSK